ncbi:MAG: DUF342 domain-containing protein [Lachnospiraceae bacterium]|nr:DUF342 domain-containing protein [Lachnospiraceae bacterium]
MEQINGYACISVEGQEVYLICYPPKDGGKRAELKDVQLYLYRQGFATYSVQIVKQCIESEKEEKIDLGNSHLKFYSGFMVTYIEPDEICCRTKIFPPSIGADPLTKEDIISSLSQEGIKYGIDEDAVQAFVDSPVYFTDLELAHGKTVVEGKDGKIEYFFNTDPSLEPKKNEDGSVDFHTLNILNNVNKGDILAKIFKEIQGESGMSITGRIISPQMVKPIKLEIGKNIVSNEEKTEFYSDVMGHVMLSQGRLVVSDVYDVTGDVDNATGNIEYAGNVNIKGSVRAGFDVKAGGDIVVEGVVEGANLDAGGNIIVKLGINGQGVGSVKADGNVIAKFIENGTVKSNGYVNVDVILASKVQADGDINVSGRKGYIAGGKISAGGNVFAERIGSEMGMRTLIEIGVKPDLKNRFNELNEMLPKLENKSIELSSILNNYQKSLKKGVKLDAKVITYLRQVAEDFKKNNDNIQRVNAEIEKIKPELLADGHHKIVVKKDIYPGVGIYISGNRKEISEHLSSCEFKIKDGELIWATI